MMAKIIKAFLAGGFQLVHGIGVVIGKDVKTCGPVKIYQHVTLGGNNNKVRQHDVYGKMAQPVLEEGVTIYTGASCFGPIVISRRGDRGNVTLCL